ncbi:fluoride efflux transporter CrcB [Sphingobium yanoikuyae]|jgi:CrcB protein|uniref:Fluoride-specific ion channel FluC n=4 Tax=Sphingomonadaceae TaxID=41297 RepID=A0A916WT94_9SPHN|nr:MULTISPECIES: fluoride efflux transporter CrcB [Sphingomonadaceae]KAA9013141.1 fluoride efflux transporter CrcB [Sphingobium limneticum]KAA9025439.1 fluoride efflux transporter CrcB [Sphingobium limneticum]MBI0477341.1 fluoride efflux transporter CrcB [Sphingomonas sp. MA1305]MDH2134565.1 fluoride efflux transporter CrcB [Sphingobium yanoikuyae]MDH2152070.1 fluoride efflux transporter CrcB [Sphingobium yanoikuyae]
MPLWTGFLVVFLGSGIGGMLRHGVGLLALRFTGANFPWGTLVINVVGSALMGLMIGLFAARSINDPELRLFVTTGLIGGFTTWSTFSLDIVTLWERGEIGSAIAYAAASIVLSLTVLAIALLAARRWG